MIYFLDNVKKCKGFFQDLQMAFDTVHTYSINKAREPRHYRLSLKIFHGSILPDFCSQADFKE